MRLSTCKPLKDTWPGVPGLTYVLGVVAIIGLIMAGIATAMATFIAAFSFPPAIILAGAAFIGACGAAIATLNTVRDYFYDYKLACIEPDVCVIGKAILMEYNPDGDKSIDLLLAPADEKTTLNEYENIMWQSMKLIWPKNLKVALSTRNWKLVPEANRSVKPLFFGNNTLPFFHCELQGTKIDDWITALIAYLWGLIGLAGAAIIAVKIGLAVPIVGWILLLALAILAFLLSIFGSSAFGADDSEASIDVDDLKDAKPNDDGIILTDSIGNNIQNGDFLLLNGPHITDVGHNPNCWTEIHPIMAIAKVSKDDYDKVGIGAASVEFIKFCNAIKDYVKNGGTIRISKQSLEHPKIG